MKQAKNVMVILYDEGFKALIEPLRPYKWAYICHNRDIDENGEVKKAHWHLLLSFETKKSLSLIAKMLNVEENLIEVVNNYKSLERYLIHLDNPDKEQYKPSEVVSNYDYEVQVYSTTESILKYLIDECQNYENVAEFNIMVMKLGIDYMKVYKQYYSMIKDVIYFNEKERRKRQIENFGSYSDNIKNMCNDELLKEYHRIIFLQKDNNENTFYENQVFDECQKRGLIVCRGLRNEVEE